MNHSNLFLVRHGESTANIDHGVYATRPQCLISLTAKGEGQAVTAGAEIAKELKVLHGGDRLRRVPMSLITSPYRRARRSAEAIAAELEINTDNIHEEWLAIEQSFGLANGSTIDLLSQSTPVESNLQWQEKMHYRPPRGESLMDVYVRAGMLMQKYRGFNICENTIVVTHAGVCHMLEAYILGETPQINPTWENGEIRMYQIEQTGYLRAERKSMVTRGARVVTKPCNDSDDGLQSQ